MRLKKAEVDWERFRSFCAKSIRGTRLRDDEQAYVEAAYRADRERGSAIHREEKDRAIAELRGHG